MLVFCSSFASSFTRLSLVFRPPASCRHPLDDILGSVMDTFGLSCSQNDDSDDPEYFCKHASELEDIYCFAAVTPQEGATLPSRKLLLLALTCSAERCAAPSPDV